MGVVPILAAFIVLQRYVIQGFAREVRVVFLDAEAVRSFMWRPLSERQLLSPGRILALAPT